MHLHPSVPFGTELVEALDLDQLVAKELQLGVQLEPENAAPSMNLSGKLVTFVKDSISLSFTSDSITGLKVGQIFQGSAGYQTFQFGSQGQFLGACWLPDLSDQEPATMFSSQNGMIKKTVLLYISYSFIT